MHTLSSSTYDLYSTSLTAVRTLVVCILWILWFYYSTRVSRVCILY